MALPRKSRLESRVYSGFVRGKFVKQSENITTDPDRLVNVNGSLGEPQPKSYGHDLQKPNHLARSRVWGCVCKECSSANEPLAIGSAGWKYDRATRGVVSCHAYTA